MKKNLQENISRIKSLMLIEKKESEDEMLNYCKGKRKEIIETFKEAKSWWVNWIQNPTFQQRFMTDFEFPEDEINDLVKYLIRIVSMTGFRFSKYIFNAYAEAGCQGGECIVYHNCDKEFEKKLYFTIYVHEIQHIINQVLRQDENLKINYSKKLDGVFIPNYDDFDEHSFKEKGRKIGIDEKTLSAMTKSINIFRSQNKDEELNRPNEMMSRVVGIRSALGLSPGEDFDLEDLKSIITNSNAFYMIAAIIATIKEGEDFNTKLQELLKILNSVAKSDGSNKLEISSDFLPPELQSNISNIA